MSAYLSIDLDYWMEQKNSRSATCFFKKVLGLHVPVTFVIEHEELVKDINKMKNMEIMYNVDYHSDIITTNEIGTEPEDYDWANFVKGKSKAEFCWIAPLEDCYNYDLGTCHVDGDEGDDPFMYPKRTGWKDCNWAIDLNLIEWDKIQRVGVCLSPCFVHIPSVKPVIKKLGMSIKEAHRLVQIQPHNHSQRTRGVISVIAA